MHPKNINKTYLAVILFAAALLLLSVPIVRVTQGNPAIPGSEHYEQVNQPSVLLSFLLGFIPQTILSISLPLLVALASLIIFASLISRHVTHENQLYYALIILVTTPSFIGLHIGLNNYQFVLFFGLLFALLYDRGTKWYFLPLSILYLLSPLLSVVLTLGVIILSSVKEKGRESLTALFFLVGLLIISSVTSLSFPTFSSLGLTVDQIFSFFNAQYGYSLFLLVLGFGGLFFEKKRTIPLLIFLASLFFEPFRILGLALLSFYAAKSFFKLQEREWTITFIGNLTLLLFVCILLFSTSTFLKETIQSSPHQGHVDALIYLEENGAQARVLSDEKLTSFITFMTGQEALSNNNYFYSQNYRYIDDRFKREDIGYILIDTSMLNGGIWQHDEEGLLFLLKYNDNFKKIYENDEVQIYYFAPWRE
ncbi:MAG: hypothetical protein KC535_01130 [Nanoarchaeota archaeon]|nr:hypothetical protein [Nanoarchaeota archaeon]